MTGIACCARAAMRLHHPRVHPEGPTGPTWPLLGKAAATAAILTGAEVLTVVAQPASLSLRLCSRTEERTFIGLPFEGGLPGEFFVGPRCMPQQLGQGFQIALFCRKATF
jgi:hypothetical protein